MSPSQKKAVSERQFRYHVDGHHTRYEINLMVTPKAIFFLLRPNESRDVQCFDNW